VDFQDKSKQGKLRFNAWHENIKEYSISILLLIVVTLIANFVTRFQSIYIFSLPLILLFPLIIKSIYFNINSKNLIHATIIFGISTAFYNLIFIDPFGDYSHYAMIIKGMENYSVETNDIRNLFPGHKEELFPSFYHYFELWLALFFKKISGINSYYTSLVNLCLPLILTSLVFSVAKNLGFLGNIRKMTILLLILLILGSPSAILNFLFNTSLRENYLMELPKLLMIMLIFSNLYNSKFNTLDIIISNFLISFLYPPAALLSTLSFLLIVLFKQKSVKPVKNVIYIILPLLLISSFYITHSFSLNSAGSSQNAFNIYIGFSDFKRAIGDFISAFLPIIFFLSIIIYVWYKSQNRWIHEKSKKLLLLLFISCVVGPIVHMWTFDIGDSQQLHSNFIDPLIYLLLIMHLIPSKKQIHPLLYTCLISLFIINFFIRLQEYSKVRHSNIIAMNQLSKNLDTNTSRFAYFNNSDYYNDIYDYSLYFKIPFAQIRRFNNKYNPTCLSVLEIKEPEIESEKIHFKKNVLNSPFYKWKNDHSKDPDSILISNFIYTKKIQLFIYQPNNKLNFALNRIECKERNIKLGNSSYLAAVFEW